MSGNVVIVDLFALVLTFCGFMMAFRQATVRRVFGWAPPPAKGDDDDAATYGLRIGGTMVMVFGFVLGMMVTLFSIS